MNVSKMAVSIVFSYCFYLGYGRALNKYKKIINPGAEHNFGLESICTLFLVYL